MSKLERMIEKTMANEEAKKKIDEFEETETVCPASSPSMDDETQISIHMKEKGKVVERLTATRYANKAEKSIIKKPVDRKHPNKLPDKKLKEIIRMEGI